MSITVVVGVTMAYLRQQLTHESTKTKNRAAHQKRAALFLQLRAQYKNSQFSGQNTHDLADKSITF